MQSIHATYRQGVFHPLGPVALPEGSEVELSIVVAGTMAPSVDAQGIVQAGTIEDRLCELALEVPREDWDRLPDDLSANLDEHLYGDG